MSAEMMGKLTNSNGLHYYGQRRTKALPSESAAPPPSEILKGLRVLVMDDDQDARELWDLALSQAGAEVTAADTVRAALEILNDWEPHILVSDIGMPGEDGYDLIRAVRARELETGRTIPALALTGYASAEDAGRARGAGYQKHISKPVLTEDLVQAVAQLANETNGRIDETRTEIP